MRDCEICGEAIPAERLEALPDTLRCVRHSTAQRVLGFTFSRFSKGTGSELAFVQPTDSETVRRAKRANGRKR